MKISSDLHIAKYKEHILSSLFDETISFLDFCDNILFWVFLPLCYWSFYSNSLLLAFPPLPKLKYWYSLRFCLGLSSFFFIQQILSDFIYSDCFNYYLCAKHSLFYIFDPHLYSELQTSSPNCIQLHSLMVICGLTFPRHNSYFLLHLPSLCREITSSAI